jgi:hypothetical protein
MRGYAVLERYSGTRWGHPYEAARLFERGPALYTSVSTPAGQVRLRLRYSSIEKDSFLMESQRRVHEGATWEPTGRAEHRRAGDRPR